MAEKTNLQALGWSAGLGNEQERRMDAPQLDYGDMVMAQMAQRLEAVEAENERLRAALVIAQQFCNSLTAEECQDTVAIPINEALRVPNA